jgi:hypothetical protein
LTHHTIQREKIAFEYFRLTVVNSGGKAMGRSKQTNQPRYTLKRVKLAIKNGKYKIRQNARETMKQDFSWTSREVEQAFSKLKLSQFYISVPRTKDPHLKYGKPPTFIDIYKCENLLDESVYTHFFFDGEWLIIDSLKKLN